MNLTFRCMYIDITDHLIILSLLKTMISKQTLDNIYQISSSKDYRLTKQNVLKRKMYACT